MKILLGMSAGAAALLTSTGAQAQSTPTPTPTPTPPPSAPAEMNWAIRNPNASFEDNFNSKVLLGSRLEPAKKYAAAKTVVDCLIRRAPKEAGSMVGGPMTSDENYAALTKALSRRYSRCVENGASGISMALVNGALAEELLRKENATLESRAMKVDVTAAEKFYGAGQSPTMASIGRCLAIYSPGMSKDVLLSSPGSAEEKAALSSLFAKSPECGVRATPADIPIEEQRSAVASGLYLWTHRG